MARRQKPRATTRTAAAAAAANYYHNDNKHPNGTFKHEFWTRLHHHDDKDQSTRTTARCGFSWHIAACLGFLMLLVVAWRNDVSWMASLLRTFSTLWLALFVAAPMLYFVVNSSSTTGASK